MGAPQAEQTGEMCCVGRAAVEAGAEAGVRVEDEYARDGVEEKCAAEKPSPSSPFDSGREVVLDRSVANDGRRPPLSAVTSESSSERSPSL